MKNKNVYPFLSIYSANIIIQIFVILSFGSLYMEAIFRTTYYIMIISLLLFTFFGSYFLSKKKNDFRFIKSVNFGNWGLIFLLNLLITNIHLFVISILICTCILLFHNKIQDKIKILFFSLYLISVLIFVTYFYFTKNNSMLFELIEFAGVILLFPLAIKLYSKKEKIQGRLILFEKITIKNFLMVDKQKIQENRKKRISVTKYFCFVLYFTLTCNFFWIIFDDPQLTYLLAFVYILYFSLEYYLSVGMKMNYNFFDILDFKRKFSCYIILMGIIILFTMFKFNFNNYVPYTVLLIINAFIYFTIIVFPYSKYQIR